MYPHRIFVSYHHADRSIVERVADAIEQASALAMWDKHLQPGGGLSDQIENFIANAHALAAVFTPDSEERP